MFNNFYDIFLFLWQFQHWWTEVDKRQHHNSNVTPDCNNFKFMFYWLIFLKMCPALVIHDTNTATPQPPVPPYKANIFGFLNTCQLGIGCLVSPKPRLRDQNTCLLNSLKFTISDWILFLTDLTLVKSTLKQLSSFTAFKSLFPSLLVLMRDSSGVPELSGIKGVELVRGSPGCYIPLHRRSPSLVLGRGVDLASSSSGMIEFISLCLPIESVLESLSLTEPSF